MLGQIAKLSPTYSTFQIALTNLGYVDTWVGGRSDVASLMEKVKTQQFSDKSLTLQWVDSILVSTFNLGNEVRCWLSQHY